MSRNLSYGMYMACIRYMAAPLFSEPRGSPTGGESATAVPCVEGGRPTGVGRAAAQHNVVHGAAVHPFLLMKEMVPAVVPRPLTSSQAARQGSARSKP